MKLGTRVYWVLALVAVIALAGAAVTLTSGLTSAGGSDPTPAGQTCDQQDQGADDANEPEGALDTDTVDEQCGDQNDDVDDGAADDQNDAAGDEGAAEDQNGAADDGAAEDQNGPADQGADDQNDD